MSLTTIEAIDTGTARRRRVTIIVPKDSTPERREAALLDGITAARKQNAAEELWRGPIDYVFAFVWTNSVDVGRTPAVARAMFVRTGSVQMVPVPFQSSRKQAVSGGVVYLPEEAT